MRAYRSSCFAAAAALLFAVAPLLRSSCRAFAPPSSSSFASRRESAAAFAPPSSVPARPGRATAPFGGESARGRHTTRAYLFGDFLKKLRGNGGNDGADDDDEKKKEAEVAPEAEEKSAAGGASVPFFAEATPDVVEEKETKVAAEEEPEEKESAVVVEPEAIVAAAAMAATAAAIAEVSPPPVPETPPKPVPPPPQPKKEPRTPLEQARDLRAAASKARLEAEKMDAQLTLEKITKLEKELGSKKVKEDASRAREIRDQLDRLSQKLSGEEAPAAAKKTDAGGTVSPLYSRDAVTGETTLNLGLTPTDEAGFVALPGTEPLTKDDIAERIALFDAAPDFLKVLVATTAGFDGVNTAADVNATALVLKLHEDDATFRKNQAEVEAENQDLVQLTNALRKQGTGEATVFGDSTEGPTFTQAEIDAKVEELEAVPKFVKNLFPDEVGKNDTALAIKMLTDDWENEQMRNSLFGGGNKKKSDAGKGSEQPGDSSLFGNFGGNDFGNVPEADRMIQSLFPKQVYDREDEDGDNASAGPPNEATMNIVMEDVLTKLKLFSPSGQPEQVSGGYIVRGSNNFDDGAALIDALDARMASSPRAKGRVLVHFVADPTPVSEEQMMVGDRDPVLYVTGPDLSRQANRPLLAGVSAFAIASSWYAALYPFLINPDVLKRAEEQVDLANAGMEFNLDWLTNQAIPLYAAFAATIAAHEIAHRVAAGAYGLNITIPTLVPSLVTGVTGQITALKDPARNRQQLLDFALAGPVAGVLTSVAFMAVGCGLTRSADAASYANFPALPVVVLRQSSLGGGIIEGVLGNGVLSLPSADFNSAVADINLPLHPLAVAGFFGLLVNACALLPFGRTDGGRIALALFGRSGTQLVGLITLVSLFFAGLTVSDLLLFYFSFIAFFQGELELPCRNEVDEVDFSRVLFATAGGVLMLLTLIPMV